MAPFVRLYNPGTDERAVEYICRETVHKDLSHEPARSISSFIWATPYVKLHPDYCFVLDSGDGTAVGYIVGAPNNKEFLLKYHAEYIPMLNSSQLPRPKTDVPAKWVGDELPTALLQLLYSPDDSLLHSEFPELLEQFPAHLLIDVLQEYQGHGYGRELMGRFVEKIKSSNIRGVHLIMAGDNVGAEAFYGRVGFTRFPAVLDNGESGELGREAGSQNVWLVRRT